MPADPVSAAATRARTDIPPLECDLVMKGGVTSGIIYPSAIAAIAEHYAIRSIGGTSAGAIGAAAAAAMEFGRRSRRNPDARAQMAELAAKLGEDTGGEPLLLRLFEPDPPTARLFRTALRLSKANGLTGKAWSLLNTPILLALLAMFVIVGAWWIRAQPGFWGAIGLVAVFVIGTILLASIIAGFYWGPLVLRGLKAASANGFGFCSGLAKAGKDLPSLTQWLYAQIQSLAGLAQTEPLTFGDLWAADERTAKRARATALKTASAKAGLAASLGGEVPIHEMPRAIELALVASDISRAQTVQLPFMRREDRLYAYLPDLRALFPEPVVEWMRGNQRPTPAGADDLAGAELHGLDRTQLIRLPWPEDMPVIVGVRMSLSFPFLFRAVRLYLLRGWDGSGLGKELVELWFADGGITSNFPLHLFDSPIPTRPTFCLNLLYHDDELQPDVPPIAGDESGADRGLAPAGAPNEQLVYMLRSNSGRLSPYTRFGEGSAIMRLMRFGGRVVTTARQWGDNQLIDVPGYRDRIVHVRMKPDEGGFNFDMGEAKIADLTARGALAGRVIAARFLPTATEDPLNPGQRLVLNWANHRFIRLRAFLAGVEVAVSRFDSAWTIDSARAAAAPTAPDYVAPALSDLIQATKVAAVKFAQQPGYLFANARQRQLAADMVQGLRELHKLAPDASTNGIDYANGLAKAPKPKQMLRLRPSADSDPRTERP